MKTYTYSLNAKELKEKIQAEIDSHHKYGYDDEITGTAEEEKIQLSVKRGIQVFTGSFFINTFYGKISQTEQGCQLKGFFSMRPFRLVLLLILFLICIQTWVFQLYTGKTFYDMLPVMIILLAVIALWIFQWFDAQKDKKMIRQFLESL